MLTTDAHDDQMTFTNGGATIHLLIGVGIMVTGCTYFYRAIASDQTNLNQGLCGLLLILGGIVLASLQRTIQIDRAHNTVTYLTKLFVPLPPKVRIYVEPRLIEFKVQSRGICRGIMDKTSSTDIINNEDSVCIEHSSNIKKSRERAQQLANFLGVEFQEAQTNGS